MEMFLKIPVAERKEILAKLTSEEAYKMQYNWGFNGRPDQQIPTQDFIVWLCLAGRGWGKTRTGAETVRQWVKNYEYVNLIGATLDDARDVMVEGESGIMNICPNGERPQYVGRELRWPNGAKSLIFTADEPERLRGKQHMKFWGDELCSWRYPESWDQIMFGLRLGNKPQGIVTTTPKPTKELRQLVADPTTFITRGHTYRNKLNLADAFLGKIVSKYEGTRLGRQELGAEILDDNPGALWSRKSIEETRVVKAPVSFIRVTVNIDPAATSNPNSDETGITVTALGSDKRGYVLADLTLRGTPDEWGRVAVNAYHDFKADRIIGEANNGGEMVEHVIRSIDRNVSYKAVHASRGKITRAEPVSALYEQKKISHIGCFPALEDEMCDYDPKISKYSPDRMDSLVWGFTELMVGMDSAEGFLDYYNNEVTESKQKLEKMIAEKEKRQNEIAIPQIILPHTGFTKF